MSGKVRGEDREMCRPAPTGGSMRARRGRGVKGIGGTERFNRGNASFLGYNALEVALWLDRGTGDNVNGANHNLLVESGPSASRSENMRRIKSKDTAPELALRSALHRGGYRFRLHAHDLPGSPDIILRRLRKAIFVHGCFWHGHDCHLFRVPKTRTNFWMSKIGRNRERDRRTCDELRSMDWEPIIVWQCELTDMRRCMQRLDRLLRRSVTGGADQG